MCLIFKHTDQNVVTGKLFKGISFNWAQFNQILFIYHTQGTYVDIVEDRKMSTLFLC